MFARFCDLWLCAILALIAFILCVWQINDGHSWGGDFSGYIAQAIALTQGEVAQYIADNTLMMTKSDWLIGPYAYPWGFPLLLAPLYKIFGFNIYAFKSVGIMCYTIFVGIFYIFCANRIPRIYAIFATLLFALNPYITNFSTNEICSDIPFMLFGFVALIILAKLFSKTTQYSMGGGRSNNGIHIAIFGGIFMLFATMIRINGLVIVCALIAMHGIMILKRFAPKIFTTKILKPLSRVDSPYSWQINAIPYAIFIIGFTIVSIALSSGGSGHWSILANMSVESVLRNLDFYIYSIMTLEDFLAINVVVGRIVFVLSVILYYIAFKSILRDNRFAENIFYIIFALGFFVLLVMWFYVVWLRFAYLLLPFLVFWCAKGIAYLNANNKIFGRTITVIILVILAHSAYNQLSSFGNNIISKVAYSKEAKEMWAFIDKNTPKDAVILFHKPRVLYLNAHRISFASNNIARFNEADFVLWERDLWSNVINIDSDEFIKRTKLIYKNAQFKLFNIVKQ